ncbi:hypothetical protein [Neptuniibacter sp.]|uniref:hypothetical protein n=1 Tax=Neptuniibacter sp. TaxID=1962643 RepID=UPI002637F8A9|nr:hypothetical protein [Neptuniibacter sp.]MCP4597064.1 hypothetical protein [Neptuniibacter sp.]
MSDFSELCPLFDTGVFHEVTFRNIDLHTGIAVSMNMLETSLSAGSGSNGWTFGRTVVVTDCFLKRNINATGAINGAAQKIRVGMRTVASATPSRFALLTVSVTDDVQHPLCYMQMATTNTTFTSDAVLDMGHNTITAAHLGNYDLMVRYREA